MVKIPDGYDQLTDPDQKADRTQLLHDFGLLIVTWNEFELYIELAILRITGLSQLHCSIVLGGLQHKAKVSILKALLHEQGNKDAVSKLKAALSHAKRNALMHGVPSSDTAKSKYAFTHRSIDDRYKAATHIFTPDEFHERVWKFNELCVEALNAIGINPNCPKTKAELKDYGKGAKFEHLE